MTGLLIQSGVGWKPDPASGPNHVVTADIADYVAEINRLIEAKAKAETSQAITERVLCVVLGLFRTEIPQRVLDIIYADAIEHVKKSSTIATDRT